MSRFISYLTAEQEAELADIAKQLVVPGKGILAADESISNCGMKFKEINLENTEENRRRYRELLFTCDKSLANYISGVILFDETARQADSEGTSLIECLQRIGIIPGIKVDKGVVHMAGTNRECTTVGIDGLKERCEEYKAMGMKFAKWRSIMKISKSTPSYLAIMENTDVIARYASICQQCGLVPIIEPEVVSDGEHDLDTARMITEDVLSFQFKALADHHVFLEGIILKPNMVTPGQSFRGHLSSPSEIGLATVQAMCRRVPAAVAGITFLSGGQGEESATLNLNEINKVNLPKPWPLTFSFGRALNARVLHIWNGDDANKLAAQEMLIKRAKANALASLGQYKSGMESLPVEPVIFPSEHGDVPQDNISRPTPFSQQKSHFPEDLNIVNKIYDIPYSQKADPLRLPSIYPSPTPAGAQTAYIAQNPSRIASTQSIQEPARQQYLYPVQEPTRQDGMYPVQEPAQQQMMYPVQEPIHQQMMYAVQEPIHQQMMYPVQVPANQHNMYPVQEPTRQQSIYSVQEPTRQQSIYSVQEPTRQQSIYSVQEPSRQQSIYAVPEPISQQSGYLAPDSTRQQSIYSVQEPTRQQSIYPAPEPTRQPSNYPIHDPSRIPSAYPAQVTSRFPSSQSIQLPAWQQSTYSVQEPTQKTNIYQTHEPSRVQSTHVTQNQSRVQTAYPVYDTAQSQMPMSVLDPTYQQKSYANQDPVNQRKYTQQEQEQLQKLLSRVNSQGELTKPFCIKDPLQLQKLLSVQDPFLLQKLVSIQDPVLFQRLLSVQDSAQLQQLLADQDLNAR